MEQDTTVPAGRQAWTKDDIARLNQALETTNGNRAHAATVLGWNRTRVDNMIIWNAALKARWSKNAPDTAPDDAPANAIDRPPPSELFSSDEVKASEALARQDALMAESWSKLGLKPKEQEFLRALQGSYATNLRGTIDLTYSGMIHTATRLLMLFEDLTAKISHIDEHPEEYERSHQTEHGERITKTAHEHRCELYDRLISVAGELRKVNSDATRAQYVRAQLDALRSGGSGVGGKPNWPKTPPPGVVLNVRGDNVHVSQQDNSPVDVPSD